MNEVSATAAACMLLAARGIDPSSITPLSIHNAIDVVYRIEEEVKARNNGNFKVPQTSQVQSPAAPNR